MVMRGVQILVAVDKNRIGAVNIPRSNNMPLIGPNSENKFLTANNETNCGMAIVIIKMVRHTFLNFTDLLLINIASKIPAM